MPQYIIKRDGSKQFWEPSKIKESVKKALSATGIEGDVDRQSQQISNSVLFGINGEPEVYQESIQNLVEKALMSSGYYDAAKNYILYREKRREIRDYKTLTLNINNTIDSYIEGKDWRINENANMDYSYQGLVLNVSGEVESKYCLNKYPEYIRDAHLKGFFHIHDLSQGLTGYCSGWSLYDLIIEGFNLEGCCSSGPAKHFDTVMSQMINFIGTLQNEWAGAQAFSSVDTLLAPFVYYDGLTYKQVKQSMQRFVYNLNTTSRWGGQCPFSNLTFDLTVPPDLKDRPVIIGGEPLNATYKEFPEEMDMINKAFLEIMKTGDYDGRIFSFPIPTYNITSDFDWDSEVGQMILEMTSKYGIPYFQNFINSDIEPSDVRSFCIDGDSLVYVEWTKTKIREKIKIKDLIENYDIQDYLIRTSIGYRPLKRAIRKEVDEVIRIKTEDGKELEMSVDHPHLVYKDINSKDPRLEVVLAKDLKEGMYTSVYHNPNTGNYWSDNMRKNMSEIKKEQYRKNPGLKKIKEDNPMFGKKHSDEVRKKISEGCSGRVAPESFVEWRRQEWSTNKNPVRTQDYWDKKDFDSNNRQISKDEKIIRDFLDNQNIKYKFQKLFYDNDRAWVADFYIPSKNLVVECQRGMKKAYYNEKCPISESYEKYDFYRKNNYNVLVVDAKNESEWIGYLNKKEEIVKVEKIKRNCYLYDVEILEEEGKRSVHNFYANDILTHNCCRLQLDKRQIEKKLKHKTGGLFGSGELTGSIGVVTLNLPKIAYLSNNKEEFYDLLRKYATVAKDALEFKRKMVCNNYDKGMFPWTKRYLKQKYDSYFSTIGVVGGHEACLNLLGKGIETDEGLDFSKEILNKLRDLMIEFQDETDNMFNLEATPAEGTSYKLAKLDKNMHPNIITSGDDTPYYTNSTQLPVHLTDDVFFALDHQNELQTLYTGGTVFHTYLQDSNVNTESLKNYIIKAFTKTKIPYLSVTPTFSICKNDGYLPGEHFICPKCGNEAEVYTRVVGYFRPVQRFNKGKKEEYQERQTFNIK